jgi:alpha-amylase/alpha-mannosidase (GH57 family)
MIMQIEDHISSEVDEKILNLTRKPATELNDDDKIQILQSFFICNEQNMIFPYPRYAELYEKAKKNDTGLFDTADWLDLQVWYNLTWFGQISRQSSELKYLFLKGMKFTEEDKILLLKVQNEVLSKIISVMKHLQELGNIEISVSPMYHPILPLLCNTDSAHEALPDDELPSPPFRFPGDAAWHLNKAINFYAERFGVKPSGLWPSEGSVSNKTMELIAEAGYKWLATDEMIMTESLHHSVNRLERFFPRLFKTGKGDLTVFFRDRLLSDLIGFNYANMKPEEAATDFINRLKYVRWEIGAHFGEDSLDYAIIPVILDGENCWEFYKDNGKPFLDALFSGLSNEPELRTVTFNEAADKQSINYLRPMNYVRAGSWINANFDIWIGQKEHIKAWNALHDARNAIDKSKSQKSDAVIQSAIDEIYIAEGSDWFWWYHDAHQAPNKHDFDIMFRDLLKNVYQLLEEDIPGYLNKPFGKISQKIITYPRNEISPDTTNLVETEWNGAGIYNTSLAMDAMHSTTDILSAVYIGNDKGNIYFRLDLKKEFEKGSECSIEITEPHNRTIEMNELNLAKNSGKILLTSISRHEAESVVFRINLKSNERIVNYPRSGYVKIELSK